MLARAEWNSRRRKLDELMINHDYNWSSFWGQPQADGEMPIEPCEAIRCHEAVGNGRFHLARCSAKRKSLSSARGRFEVDIHTEMLNVNSGHMLGMGTALKSAGEPCGVGH